jgi:hypothetical protein
MARGPSHPKFFYKLKKKIRVKFWIQLVKLKKFETLEDRLQKLKL